MATSNGKRKSVEPHPLPFVDRSKKGKDGGYLLWSVPPKPKFKDAIEEYGYQCNVGSDWAAHYAKYLREQNGAGLGIGHIASDIDFQSEKDKGYWVGFFSTLESFVAIGANAVGDPFKFLDECRLHAARQRAERRVRQEQGRIRNQGIAGC